MVIEDNKEVRKALVDKLQTALLQDSDQLTEAEYEACGLPLPSNDPGSIYIFIREDEEGILDGLIIELANVNESLKQKHLCDRPDPEEVGNKILGRLLEEKLPYRRSVADAIAEREQEGEDVQELRKLEKLFAEHKGPLDPAQILACFDLELRPERREAAGMLFPDGDVYGGHWILYATANKYPGVPRLIITGFRTEAPRGLASGAGSFLTKPVTVDLLRRKVKEAQDVFRVHWLCPANVRNNYEDLLDGLTFDRCKDLLKEWLGARSIGLHVRTETAGVGCAGTGEQLDEAAIARSSLIVLDLFEVPKLGDSLPQPHENETCAELLQQIIHIRCVSPSVPIIVIVPACGGAEGIVAHCYRSHPLRLRAGADAIIKKPMWLAADGHPDSNAGLGNMIVQQLQLDVLDVKYQVIIPIAAIIGRLDGAFVRRVQTQGGKKPGEEWDQFYAPLLPALIRRFGLAGPTRELSYALAKFRVREALEEYIQQARQEDEDRWKHTAEEAIQTAVAASVDFIQHELVNHHAALEAWLRKAVDEKARQKTEGQSEGFDEYLKPLVRVFGGSTRYEFTVNGSWYSKEGQRIDDLLVVIEFGAKSSLAARAFIETTVVKYLSRIAGEQVVMVQEIPIRGYFTS